MPGSTAIGVLKRQFGDRLPERFDTSGRVGVAAAGTVVAASRPIAPAAENSRRDMYEVDVPMLLPLEFADRSVRRGVTVADPAMRR